MLVGNDELRSCLSYQKFICGGRIVFGPDATSLFLTSILIGAPAITFCIKMVLRIKIDDPHFSYPILLGGLLLTVLVSVYSK